tara:strand:- start:497 stop:1228 length:732 start_codon:yes stop_codon:yes gene_type:complete
MVYFVCEGCNETLKKNQVDKHAARCRVCAAVTCVDCSVTFYGDDYAEHLTCVSEAEKHQGGLYKAKNVKMNPQETWNNVVETACARSKEAPANVQPLLVRLGDLSNVPRQKKKFDNFIKNSLRLFHQDVMDQMWSFLEKIKAEIAPAKVTTTAAADDKKVEAPVVEVSPVEEKKAVEGGTDDDAEKKKLKKEAKKAKKEARKRKAEDQDDLEKEENSVEQEEGKEEQEKKSPKKKKKKKEKKE